MLREDIHLATPPPHPSEAPIINPNPLSTAPHPIVAGTKLSLVQFKSRETPNLYRNPAVSSSRVTQDGDESRISGDTDEESSVGRGGSGSLESKSGGDIAHVPEKFGNGNASLSAVMGKNQKKKPKSNIAKSNSSFVSRIITHENLTKRLAERQSEDLMVFANINRAFCWLDMDSAVKVLSQTCHSSVLSKRMLIYILFATARTIIKDPLYKGPPDMS